MASEIAPLRELVATEGSAEPWVAVNTHAHREQVAIENLRRQVFASYCPLVQRTVRRGRLVQYVKRPLFPGYVFVALDPGTQRWRPILSTFGVRSLVRVGEQPARLPPGFVEALRAREIDGVVEAEREVWQCGQPVRLTSGALEGLVGNIVQMSEKSRIVVLMELLNQQVRVHVDRGQLAAVN